MGNQNEELQKYLNMLELYKGEIEYFEEQSTILQSAIIDYNKAKLTIQGLSGKKNILLPIGGGSYINAYVENPSKILVDVGADVIVEKKSEDAVEKINDKIEDLKKQQEHVFSMISRLTREYDELSKKAEKLIRESIK